MPRRRWLSIACCLFGCMAAAALQAEEISAIVKFRRDVQPILEQHCKKCHGPEKQQGGVRLDHQAGLVKAADSGSPAVVPGHVAKSELIRRVEAADSAERMPPNAVPLSPEQIKILRTWIEQGATWPEESNAHAEARSEMAMTDEDRQHWSYRPLGAVDPPTVKHAAWAQTPIDRFLLAAQEAKGIHPNPPADARVLIRRAYFDLVGLPPSPADVETFAANPSPAAYEELVDRLLSSSHYGERWGQHWLDLARYADSDGLETDADRPTAYHYRDFVIRALNDDLSFQTFTRWQLAGDEYEPDNSQALAATGFLTGAPFENLMVPMEEERLRLRYNELDDMAVTTVSAFLGLTLGCARCHDHKFDSIPTRDYYRLQSAFTTTSRANVLLAPRAEAARFRAEETKWNQRLKAVQSNLKDWLATAQKPHTDELRIKKIDALAIGADAKMLLKEKPESEAGKKLAKQHEKSLLISEKDYREVFSDDERRQWDAFQREVSAVDRTKPRSPPQALAIVDTASQPGPTWLLERGDFYAKKSSVELGFLTVLTTTRSPAEFWEISRRDAPSDQSTGQRRALADWITDIEHGAGALLARVIVNRVWQHHFGEGLVRTPSDFGVRGERPTHPELLEWLAHHFVAGGWRLKLLHRLILLSSAYRQGTEFDAARAKLDPDNRLLWHRRPQRLEAEILRDAVLKVSGTLNTEPFGPAFKPPIPADAIIARNTKSPYPKDAQDTPATRRRAVYMFHKRVTQHPLMQAFDQPDTAVSCARRNQTTVAPQALALLNDSFLRDRAADFASRMIADTGGGTDDAVQRGFWMALSRPPSETERAASRQFIENQLKHRAARDKTVAASEIRFQSLADFCQALFSLNEFIYVD